MILQIVLILLGTFIVLEITKEVIENIKFNRLENKCKKILGIKK